MLLGLGTLAELKAHLLADTLQSGTDYDAKIASLGLGVAQLFEKRCARKFYRTEDDVFEFSADRSFVVLPRYPIEAITKVELGSGLPDAWIDQGAPADLIQTLDAAAGIVDFGALLGSCSDRARITFTGGYWFPDTPAEEEEAEEMPEDAIVRPDDLFSAWKLQCEYVWKLQDKLGTSIVGGGSSGGELLGLSIAGVQLLPYVVDHLRPYVRMTLT